MSNYEIKSDLSKNRLFVTLSGFLTDEQMKTAADMVISETKKLKPGFSVINDISNFQPASKAGTEEIQKAQIFVKNNGAGRIVRIVKDNALANMQFSRVTKTAGYNVDEATSVEEAEKLLGN